MSDEQTENLMTTIELASEITIAWLGNPNVRVSADDVPTFLKTLHATIEGLSKAAAPAEAEVAPEFVPAVPVRSSVKPDYIVSLIDGRKFKSLKRHLSAHDLTPDEYRERYGLKSDYPMVAATYSAHRREVAQKLGLGRKSAAPVDMPAPAPAPDAEAPAAPAKARRARVTPAAPMAGDAAPAKRTRAKKAPAE